MYHLPGKLPAGLLGQEGSLFLIWKLLQHQLFADASSELAIMVDLIQLNTGSDEQCLPLR